MVSTTGAPLPSQCPSCAAALTVTRLQCRRCGAEVAGAFTPGRLINVPEPHAALLELFLRVRGNVKDMERELGLSYPTVRARLEKALAFAGFARPPSAVEQAEETAQRAAILEELAQGNVTAADAVARLREMQRGRST